MTTQSDLVQQLHEIAGNLWWCWHQDVWQLFEELDPTLWRETNHNPTAMLKRLAPDVIEQRARTHALSFRIQQAVRRLRDYMADTGPRANMEAGPLHKAPVAYFCAEFGLHESLPIYSGGLGILAGDHLKACSDLNIPLVGIGLFYALGYFRQTVDATGRQQEHYDRALASELPITKVMDAQGLPVEIAVESGAGTIHAQVWRAQVGRIALYLLDADVAKNSEEDRALTSLLYGGDKRTRIRQELLLGVGGVRMLEQLGIRPGVYHLNEGHSAFAPLELCHQYMRREGLSFEHAKRRVSKRTVFTTHTPVPAGHDRFDLELFEDTMRPLRERLGLDHYTLHGLGRVDPNNPGETFCMTVLAIKMTDHRNGVSHIHGRVSRHMWRDLWPHKETHTIPIGHITNGVHVGTFLAPAMRTLYDKYLTPGWERHMERPEAWSGLDSAEPGEVWEIHQILKSELIDFVHERVQYQQAPRGEQPGQLVPGSGLDPDVLTLGFARRFATYKRANLLFSDMERFKKLLLDADRPIQVIFAGKAHPKDEGGKQLIKNIIELTTSPQFKGRVVFLSDYNTNIARHLVRGVDVWLNNPRRPQEACGTSGQKAVLNGVLNCSILDGWWAEGYDGLNGFAIGDGAEHEHEDQQDDIDADALYDVLEREVIPLYYKRAASGLPLDWIDRMKWSIVSQGWKFNANRMVLDYMRNAYLPAVGATTARIG